MDSNLSFKLPKKSHCNIPRTESTLINVGIQTSLRRKSINLIKNRIVSMKHHNHPINAKEIYKLGKRLKSFLATKKRLKVLSINNNSKDPNKNVKDIILGDSKVPIKVLQYEQSLLHKSNTHEELPKPINNKMNIVVKVNHVKSKQEESEDSGDELTYRLLPKYKESHINPRLIQNSKLNLHEANKHPRKFNVVYSRNHLDK